MEDASQTIPLDAWIDPEDFRDDLRILWVENEQTVPGPRAGLLRRGPQTIRKENPCEVTKAYRP